MSQTKQAAADAAFVARAVAEARAHMQSGRGGPFGALVVKDGRVVGSGCNEVTTALDPTAHAEVQAIRAACRALNAFQLTGCTLYTSCEPCPMCLGAIYWARPDRVVFAATRFEAASAGFDDAFIYDEIPLAPEDRKIPFERVKSPEALELFEAWKNKTDKVEY